MKRSQMLGYITEIISEVTYERLATERAARVLNTLERLGMKPPNRKRCFCHDCECIPDNTWEPENDRS